MSGVVVVAGELQDGSAPALGVARRAVAVDEFFRTPQDAAVVIGAVAAVAIGGRRVVVEAAFGGAAVGRGGGELRAHVA